MTTEEQDGRMSFEQAVHYVQNNARRAAFAAAPVFGERSEDEEQRAGRVSVPCAARPNTTATAARNSAPRARGFSSSRPMVPAVGVSASSPAHFSRRHSPPMRR